MSFLGSLVLQYHFDTSGHISSTRPYHQQSPEWYVRTLEELKSKNIGMILRLLGCSFVMKTACDPRNAYSRICIFTSLFSAKHRAHQAQHSAATKAAEIGRVNPKTPTGRNVKNWGQVGLRTRYLIGN